jgi:hypothetical protein
MPKKFKPPLNADGRPIPDPDEVRHIPNPPVTAETAEWQKKFDEKAKAIVAEAQAKMAADKP